MRFDTFLKLGTHAANIWKHDSFQEMSKMIHRGVKRRIQVPEHHPMHFGHFHGPYGPYSLGPHPVPRRTSGQAQANSGSKTNAANPPLQQIGQLLTPNNIQSALAIRQMIKEMANFGKK